MVDVKIDFGFPESETKHSVCADCKTLTHSCSVCGYIFVCKCSNDICRQCYGIEPEYVRDEESFK